MSKKLEAWMQAKAAADALCPPDLVLPGIGQGSLTVKSDFANLGDGAEPVVRIGSTTLPMDQVETLIKWLTDIVE